MNPPHESCTMNMIHMLHGKLRTRAERVKRKCLKCGSVPSDNIKMFRFPKPSIRNLERCTLWTKFVYPDAEYSSMALQMELHKERNYLCEKHFNDNDFIDSTKKIMVRRAIPSIEIENDKPKLLNNDIENSQEKAVEAI